MIMLEIADDVAEMWTFYSDFFIYFSLLNLEHAVFSFKDQSFKFSMLVFLFTLQENVKSLK